MAELIDILVTRDQTGVGLGIDERQTFTVVVAPLVFDVEIDASVAGQGLLRPADNLNYKVALKDNITILSIGVSFPYNFGLSTRNLYMHAFWADGIGGGPLNIGAASLVELPFGNYEVSIGNFVSFPAAAVAAYSIHLVIGSAPDIVPDRARISMIGVPAGLNAAVLPITTFMKISHNLPLVA